MERPINPNFTEPIHNTRSAGGYNQRRTAQEGACGDPFSTVDQSGAFMSETSEHSAFAPKETGPQVRRAARGPHSLTRLQLENLKRAAGRLKDANRHVLLRAVDDAERRLSAT
jgi:hypothetical protein